MNIHTEVPVDADILDLVPAFLSARAKELTLIEVAALEKNYVAIAKLAHTIKGISDPYGFPGLGQLARELETVSCAHKDKEVEGRVMEMRKYLSEFVSLSVSAMN